MFWSLFYAALTLIAGIFVYLGYKRGDHVEDTGPAWAVLALLCLLTNLSHAFIHHPYNQFFPILDGLASLLLWAAWRHRLRTWKVVLILTFLIEGLIHAIDFNTLSLSRYQYDLLLNLFYSAQLICVSALGFLALFGPPKAKAK